jgi:chromosome segregation ATPase
VQAQVDAAKARHFEQAKAARAALDQSLAQFEQQVADAKQMTRDNPELTAYIAAAQKFQETTRSLVDELMRRQQQQYAQLTDLQSRLNDKMQQRREELWQKDEQLQRMNDALEYAKRQLNAALGTGQEQQANDLKAEIALRETTIKAREDMIPVDPIYADAISQLQKIVDQQQKSMAEDRQTTAKALEEAQNEFANSQPAVDKLPDEQKSLAADMEKRLADLTTARAKYSEAAAAMDDGQDEETRKLQEQANSIATSIDLHRKQVADSTSKQEAQALESKRQKDIADKQTQITQLTQAVADAQAAYNAKVDELQDKQARLDKSRQAGEQLQALSDKQALLQKQIAQLQADLEFKKEAARDSVEPVMITDADIHQHPGLDKRLPYALETSIPLLLLCLGSVFWTIHLASRELPLNALSPTDDDGHPEPFSLPSPAKAGHNGASAGANGVNGHGPQEHANGETATALASLSGSDDDATGEATGATMADVPEAGRGEGDSQPADAMANR